MYIPAIELRPHFKGEVLPTLNNRYPINKMLFYFHVGYLFNWFMSTSDLFVSDFTTIYEMRLREVWCANVSFVQIQIFELTRLREDTVLVQIRLPCPAGSTCRWLLFNDYFSSFITTQSMHVYSYFIYLGCDPFNFENMFLLYENLLKYNDADPDTSSLKAIMLFSRKVWSDTNECFQTFGLLTSGTPCCHLSARESSVGQGGSS